MLKCITFDGDVTTLNDLMEYLEQINRILAEVSAQLSNKQVAQPVFLREGTRIVRLNQEDILYLEGYGGDYIKVHRTEGKPILSQVSLKRFEECLGGNFVVCTVPILFHYLILIISSGKGFVSEVL